MTDEPTDILIYGVIGRDPWTGEGVSAQDVAHALKAAGPQSPVRVRINSVGGLASDGLAIHNLLVQHQGHVSVDIDGYALSAGSIVAMGGDTIRMAENALMMIHNGQALAMGDQRTMTKMAEILEVHDEQIARTYARRTGRKDATFRAMMDEETWLTAAAALEAKLVDEVTTPQKVENLDRKTAATWNYHKVPENVLAGKPLTKKDKALVQATISKEVVVRRLLEIESHA